VAAQQQPLLLLLLSPPLPLLLLHSPQKLRQCSSSSGRRCMQWRHHLASASPALQVAAVPLLVARHTLCCPCSRPMVVRSTAAARSWRVTLPHLHHQSSTTTRLPVVVLVLVLLLLLRGRLAAGRRSRPAPSCLRRPGS
jgi:hypothetical protein